MSNIKRGNCAFQEWIMKIYDNKENRTGTVISIHPVLDYWRVVWFKDGRHEYTTEISVEDREEMVGKYK